MSDESREFAAMDDEQLKCLAAQDWMEGAASDLGLRAKRELERRRCQRKTNIAETHADLAPTTPERWRRALFP